MIPARTLHRPKAVLPRPQAVLHCPKAVLHCPKAVLRCLAATLLFFAAEAGMAALTPVNPSGGGSGFERCLVGPVCPGAGAYAGAESIVRAFERSLGLSPGAMIRIDDAADRLWTTAPGGPGAVRPIARYANDEARLGFGRAGSFTALTGVLASGRVEVDDPALFTGTVRAGDFVARSHGWTPIGAGEAPFAFVLDNLSSGRRLASDVAISGYATSGRPSDWMVTWKVPGADHYLFAWEDRTQLDARQRPNDWDYNDFVFEAKGVAIVPLPAAAGLLVAGLALLAGAAGRRRR